MATTLTPTTSAAAIPALWANKCLEVLRAQMVLAPRVWTDKDVTPGQSFSVGDTLHVFYPGTFTANDKTPTAAITLQAPTGTDTTIVLNKHKETSFLLEDITKALANPGLFEEYAYNAVIPIAEQIETDLWAQYANVTASVGTTATDLTAATIRAAAKKLDDNKVPQAGRVLVISPKDKQALFADTTLASYLAFADPAAVRDGAIGHIFGFEIVMSQFAPLVSTSTKNLAMVPGALVLAMRSLPQEPAGPNVSVSQHVAADPMSGLMLRVTMSYSHDFLGTKFTVDALYGTKLLRDAKAVVVLS